MAKITQANIQLKARIAVLEFMVAHLYAMNTRTVRRIFDIPKAEMMKATRKEIRKLKKTFAQRTFPGLDPAMSDLWASELEVVADDVLEIVEEFLQKGGV